MYSPQKIADLLFKYLRKELTKVEWIELKNWRRESIENERKFTELTDPVNLQELMKDYYSYRVRAWDKLLEEVPEIKGALIRNKQIIWWKRFAVAVSIIVLSGTGIYIMVTLKQDKEIVKNSKGTIEDVPPGSNKAILTLSSGSKIILDEPRNHSFAIGKIDNIRKLDSNILSYQYLSPSSTDVLPKSFNTLETPRGGQFQLFLPDGTHVWLNAQSSITYPIDFSGKQRIVVLKGEAYFEVTKDVSKPFHVKVGGIDIEDLGTHFNINAYTDEVHMVTTLLEGSIKVTDGSSSDILKPGDQVSVDREIIKQEQNSKPFSVSHKIDVDDVVAWKNGRTLFKDKDIKTIMRMISRWYDVDVTYQGNIPNHALAGGISRNANLSAVLRVLEIYNLRIIVKDKRITVTPK